MTENLNYDVMGNIWQLKRDGSALNQYHYAGNGLSSVDNVANTYQYDANGNAITDGRGMMLTYNHLNLPATANGNGTSVAYTYDAIGQKLNKSALRNGLTTSHDYISGIEYKNNIIELIHTEEGVAQSNGDNTYTYHYNLSDHLGNVRFTFDIYNGSVRRLQADDYSLVFHCFYWHS